MKKLLIVLLILLSFVLILPNSVAYANGLSGTTTSVTVTSGGGTVPAVKCKWEQQPISVNTNLEDGDSPHAVPGFQILPPLVKCMTKTIEYYAVVTDVEDGGNLSQAFADVYHPSGSPEPYGPSKVGGVLSLPYFKYEVPFVDLQTGSGAITKAAAAVIVNSAYTKGLITFGSYTLADVLYELDKGTAHLWMGTAEIDYEQPAGNYDVKVFAVDTNNNLSAVLANQFTYVAVAGIEADFTGIDFGSVNLGVEKMIPGDVVWNTTPGLNNATVRNIGNTWASLTLRFNDMGFGKDVTGKWNVNFDARMGSDNTFYVAPIMPDETITLTNALKLSSMDELDLSIKILKGFGSHIGTVTLGSVIRSFTYAPANVVGTPAPCDPRKG